MGVGEGVTGVRVGEQGSGAAGNCSGFTPSGPNRLYYPLAGKAWQIFHFPSFPFLKWAQVGAAFPEPAALGAPFLLLTSLALSHLPRGRSGLSRLGPHCPPGQAGCSCRAPRLTGSHSGWGGAVFRWRTAWGASGLGLLGRVGGGSGAWGPCPARRRPPHLLCASRPRPSGWP